MHDSLLVTPPGTDLVWAGSNVRLVGVPGSGAGRRAVHLWPRRGRRINRCAAAQAVVRAAAHWHACALGHTALLQPVRALYFLHASTRSM
jgi:hypothetical protein